MQIRLCYSEMYHILVNLLLNELLISAVRLFRYELLRCLSSNKNEKEKYNFIYGEINCIVCGVQYVHCILNGILLPPFKIYLRNKSTFTFKLWPSPAYQFFHIGTIPVSYTHLDVYKRQMLRCSIQLY